MKKTSNVRVSQATKAVPFNSKNYQRGGITEDEVLEIK